ncbi:spexin prohormone 2 isoform X2 [Paramormyrops kingsleyae]|uniref:spexin prohormone 2 isoform X2 n=1 Tax=Paramormyrops kingsleyae TaxID=1676925 RepID=UPI003B970C6C
MERSKDQEYYGVYSDMSQTYFIFPYEDDGILTCLQAFIDESSGTHSDVRADGDPHTSVAERGAVEPVTELESSTAAGCAWTPEGEGHYSLMSHCGALFLECLDQPGEKITTQGLNICQAVGGGNGPGQTVALNICDLSPHSLRSGQTFPVTELQFESMSQEETTELSATRGKVMTNLENIKKENLPAEGSTMAPPYLPPSIIPPPQPGPDSLSSTCFIPPVSLGAELSYSTLPRSYVPQTPCAVYDNSVVLATQRKPETSLIRISEFPGDSRSKRPCNCTKSQCLKFYCDCFANGEICSNCNCINCHNNTVHESERIKAIKTYLKRNPEAFQPKIASGILGELNGRHNKGCNCKRSGCLKNYCECYEAKIMCSYICKCVSCKNYDLRLERKMGFSEDWSNKQDTNLYGIDTDQRCKCPLACVTLDAVKATCGCLIARAEEAEKEGFTLPQAEAVILWEFGQCLMQIIQSIFKHKDLQV